MLRVLSFAVNYLLALLFRGVVFKFSLLLILYYILQILFELLISFLPSWFGFNGLFDNISPQVWYFLDLIAFDVGFPLYIGALGVKFLIRRIPFIG